jgi:hypothetical protein
VEDARAAGLEVTLFLPPLSRCELDAISQTGTWDTLQRWKRELLVAGPYWDFSGYGKLDRVDAYFLDVPHFKPTVGQVMLRQLLGTDCRQCGESARIIHEAGEWVTTATVEAYLARQEAMRAASDEPVDRCAPIVREVLHAHVAAPIPR